MSRPPGGVLGEVATPRGKVGSPVAPGEVTASPGEAPADPDEAPAGPVPLDLRLLIPALTAWAATVALVVHGVRPQLAVGATCLVLALAVLALLLRRGVPPRWSTLPLVALTLAATALVLLVSAAHRATDEVGPVPELAAERAVVTVTGTVLTEPRLVVRGDERPDLVVFQMRLTRVEGRGTASQVSTPVVTFADAAWRDIPWRAEVTTTARLGPPDEGESVLAVVQPLAGPRALPDRMPLLAATDHVRERLRSSVDPLPVDARALIPGLVIGDTSLTPTDLTDAMLATGMTHLSAVSGSNVAIVVGSVILLCGWCGVPRRWRPLLAVLSLVGFVLLCRPEPSVLRAGAMGLVGLLGLSASRRAVSLPALATAILVLLCYDPWLARSYGFALSSLATLGLIVFARPWGDAIGRRLPRRVSRLGDAVSIPLAAQVVCAPVIVLLQGNVSTVAVLTNLLAAPLVAPTTLAGIGAALAGTVWLPLGILVAWVGALPAWLIGAVARWGARVPFGTIDWVEGPAGAWLLTVLTVLVLAAGPWLRSLLRWHPVMAAAALLVLVALVWPAPGGGGWPPRGWVVTGCDVGQGDAFVVPTGPGHAILIDTGPEPQALQECLDQLGVVALDALVLSHFHADHIGGIEAVVGRLPVEIALVTPLREPPRDADRVLRRLAEEGIPVRAVTAGEQLHLGSRRPGEPAPVQATVIWPSEAAAGLTTRPAWGANDASLVLDLAVGDTRMLFTGDIEPRSASAVRRALTGETFTVLKVAHHGSAAQDPGLVTGVRARVALIGVGADNNFGHPSRSVLELLAQTGTVVLRTDQHGSYAVVNDDGEFAVVTSNQ